MQGEPGREPGGFNVKGRVTVYCIALFAIRPEIQDRDLHFFDYLFLARA